MTGMRNCLRAWPSTGAVLWTQPPSNLYIFMDPDSGSGSGSSGRRLGALENPEAAAGAVVEYVELSLEQEAALVGGGAAQQAQQQQRRQAAAAAAHRRLRHHQQM